MSSKGAILEENQKKCICIKATDTVANKRLEVSESDLEVKGSGMPSLDMEIFL